MRVPVSRRRKRLEMNMTPMIDVVFLLIIFFLVSSHLAKQEVQAELTLPTATKGNDQTDTAAARITINISDGNGTPLIQFGAMPVTRAEVSSKLQREMTKAGEKLEIRIRADRRVPFGTVKPVMAACAKLGIWNVKLMVKPEQ
ncbi:MAG: biopolymer transporter ExbD [Pirellulales bacterium]